MGKRPDRGAPDYTASGTVVTITYNAANMYVPQTMVADAGTGKLNLSIAFTYDAAGNRTRLTWPETSFYVTTTYDALNRPSAIKELGTTNLAPTPTTTSPVAPRSRWATAPPPATATAPRARSPASATTSPAPR
ncbi:hypothetical protein, partial [Parazoarcus communis]